MHVYRVAPDNRAQVIDALRTNFGEFPDAPYSAGNLLALDSIEAGRHAFAVEHEHRIIAVVCVASLMVMAGSPAAAPDVYAQINGLRWDILIGDYDLVRAVELRYSQRRLFKRAYRSRVQHVLGVTPDTLAVQPLPEGGSVRLATARDITMLTEMGAQLHVDDQMGRPLSRTTKQHLARQYASSVIRNEIFVVEYRGQIIGKTEVTLAHKTWGCQIVGVYIDRHYRGQGWGTAIVGAVADWMFHLGYPLVTLHMRDGNEAALGAYTKVGMTWDRRWNMVLGYN